VSKSNRAEPRRNYFRRRALTRLQSHTPLTNRLENPSSIDTGADVIVPTPYLQKQHLDDEEPPDVAVAVSVVVSDSERRNNQDDISIEIQTDLQIRKVTLFVEGLAWHDEIADEISSIMTEHEAGWHAGGETGGTVEPLWDDDIRRYRTAQRFAVESSTARELES